MECSICYENITKETGKAELSCSHTFHLNCLSKWFLKNENCPCCRHTANETEKMSSGEPTEDESTEDSEDEEDSDDSDDEYVSTPEAKERARIFIEKQKARMTKEEFEAYAATRFAALVRGHQIRMFFFEFRCLDKDVKYNEHQINEATLDIKEWKEEIVDYKLRQKYYKKVAGLSRPQINTFSATMIQSVWRGKKQQKFYKEMKDLANGVKIELKRLQDGTWERIYKLEFPLDFSGVRISDSE